MTERSDPRLHFVVATCIVVKSDTSEFGDARPRFLILQRAPHEKAFPEKWCVPGGKLVRHEYESLPQTADFPQWYNVVEWVVRKELQEEASIEVGKLGYVCDIVFVRPDGYPVVTLSYWAPWKSGDVVLDKSHTEYAWVTLEEAKDYDLIDGIWGELRDVEALVKDQDS